MSTKTKIAFVCYLLAILVHVGVGVRYLLAAEIMPYHQQVTGADWADLAPGVQAMLLTFINGAGRNFLVTAGFLSVLLLVPFRHGDRWSRWAITFLGLAVWVPAAVIAARLATSSGAAIPWQRTAIPIGLLIAGFLLSGDVGKAGLKE
jgi:hypothetical protein